MATEPPLSGRSTSDAAGMLTPAAPASGQMPSATTFPAGVTAATPLAASVLAATARRLPPRTGSARRPSGGPSALAAAATPIRDATADEFRVRPRFQSHVTQPQQASLP